MAAPLNMRAFWARVDKHGPIYGPLGTPCWLWLGGRGGKGTTEQRYGQVGSRRAHRVSYETLVGPIPDGLVLDHLCRRTYCVNPGHVEPVTHRVNILRGDGLAARNAKKSRCDHGHLLRGKNLLVSVGRRGLPRRACRKCAAARLSKWKAKQA